LKELRVSYFQRLTGTASTGPSLDFEPENVKNMSCAIAIEPSGEDADHDDRSSRYVCVLSDELRLSVVAGVLGNRAR